MRIATLALILFCVSISAGAQIALKAGMTARSIRPILDSGDAVRILVAMATSPMVVLGLVTYGLSAIIWMLILSRVALSTAYPFIALGIALTVLAGRFLFHEPMTLAKLAGIGMILAGIIVIGLEGEGRQGNAPPVNRPGSA